MNVLELNPRDFSGYLREMQSMGTPPEQIANLQRAYRDANTGFGLLAAARDDERALAQEGRAPIIGGLLSIPQEDARQGLIPQIGGLLSGGARNVEYEGVMPMVRSMAAGTARAANAPASAAMGLVPREDMIGEAMGTAGLAMGGGGVVASKPSGALGANTLRVYHGGPNKLSASEVEMRPDPEGTPIGFSVTDNPDVAEYYRNMRGGGSISEFDIDLDKANIISEMELYKFVDDLENRIDADPSYEQIQRGLLDAGIDAIEYPDPEFGIRVVNPNILGANASKSAGLLSVAADVADQGDLVLNMLKSGRGSDVTDDMLDMGDSVKNTQLNQYLFENYDLPMNEASRMARAAEQERTASHFHGAMGDYRDLRPSVRGKIGPGVYTAEEPNYANSFAGKVYGEDEYLEGGNVYPLLIKDNPAPDMFRTEAGALRRSVSDPFEGADLFSRYLDDLGFSGVKVGGEQTTVNPSNIRSRFARFDPRLSHLSNLNAANASPLGGLLAPTGMSEEQQRRIERYLSERGLLQ